MCEYNMKKKEGWTNTQNGFLLRNYAFCSYSELADAVNKQFKTNRSRSSVKSQVWRLRNKNKMN